MTDALGVPVQPGDTIAYPSRKRSKLWLRILKVQSINGDRISGLSPIGRQVTIQRPDGGQDLIVARGDAL